MAHTLLVKPFDPIIESIIRGHAKTGAGNFVVAMLGFLDAREVEKRDVRSRGAHVIREIQVVGAHIVLINGFLNEMET